MTQPYPTKKTVHTKVFRVWNGIKSRCTNPNAANYQHYGAKGVTMCTEWINDFQAFAAWYVDACTKQGLDPENHNYQVDKDILCTAQGINPPIYSPKTCLLVNHITNTTSGKTPKQYVFVDEHGTEFEPQTIKQFADEQGLSYNALRNLTSGRTKTHKGFTVRN